MRFGRSGVSSVLCCCFFSSGAPILVILCGFVFALWIVFFGVGVATPVLIIISLKVDASNIILRKYSLATRFVRRSSQKVWPSRVGLGAIYISMI